MAVSEVNNIYTDDSEYSSLEHLKEIGIALPTDVDLNVVKSFLSKEKIKNENTNKSILKILFPVKDAFVDTYRYVWSTFKGLVLFGSRKKRIVSLNIDDIIRKFAEKNRKIQLF